MRYITGMVVVAAVAAVTAISTGQIGRPDKDFHHIYRPLVRPISKSFLKRYDVRSELRITAEQEEQMRRLEYEERAARRSLRGQRLSYEERVLRETEIEQQYDLRQVLSQSQRARLFQLELQWNGALSLLLYPEVARQIGLSQSQQQQIHELVAREAEKIRYNERGIGRYEKKVFHQQARERVNQEILALLTPQQRAQWQRTIGAPFQFVE